MAMVASCVASTMEETIPQPSEVAQGPTVAIGQAPALAHPVAQPLPSSGDESSDDDDDEGEVGLEFEFPFVSRESPAGTGAPADELFAAGRIRTFYPVFGRGAGRCVAAHGRSSSCTALPAAAPPRVRGQLGRLFPEETRERNSSTSSTASTLSSSSSFVAATGDDGLEGKAPESYCEWRPSPSASASPSPPQPPRKSASTGSRRRISDLVVGRRHSDAQIIYYPHREGSAWIHLNPQSMDLCETTSKQNVLIPPSIRTSESSACHSAPGLLSSESQASGNQNTTACPSALISKEAPSVNIPFMRKRGKHGPESRIPPLAHSPMTDALNSYGSRLGEPVFMPAIGMEFNSLKDAKDFYNLYSWEIGFGIRKGRNHTNGNNYTTWQDLVCSCEGVCPNDGASTCRTGCKAMVRLHRSSDHGWVINRVLSEHNHQLSATYAENKQWPSHSEIDPMTKDVVQKLRENNIPIGRVCSILGVHGPQSAQPIRKEAIKYLCANLAQKNIKDDIGKTVSLLQEMKRTDVGMEITFSVDHDGNITSLLWCTGKNRFDYAMFGDVVTFDTTYRTNLYNLPFGLFVGVNNHFQSIVFGGVLLTSEKMQDFEWCFRSFLNIMGGKAPQTILTDQCQAMDAAIKSTMMHTQHRWCRWHVLRKTKQNVGTTYSKHSNFKKEFNKLVTNEIMVSRFERKWRQLMQTYNLENNEFLQRLYKNREKWAKPYFMDIFCAGMTSTQRSESANHMLKQFIHRSASMLMFVQKFNEFHMDRNDQEGKEVHVTKQMRRKRRVGVPIERHAESIYTRNMYDRFYTELYSSGAYIIKNKGNDGVFEVAHSYTDGHPDQVRYMVHFDGGNKVHCQCGLYEHVGLLCRHSLKVLIHFDVKEIPSGNIMHRWMKDLPQSKNIIAPLTTSIVTGATTDALKKRVLLSRTFELVYGQDELRDDTFSQAMAFYDTVGIHDDRSYTTSLHTSTSTMQIVDLNGQPMINNNRSISCPDEPTMVGRSCRLKSWTNFNKWAQRPSTDEENPKGGKTRRIDDGLGIK